MDDRKRQDDSGHDHPQTIDAEPLDETRSGKLLEEQGEKKTAFPNDEVDDE